MINKHKLLATDHLSAVRLTAKERDECDALLANWLVLHTHLRAVQPSEASMLLLLKLMRRETMYRRRGHILERLRRKLTTMRTHLEQKALKHMTRTRSSDGA